MPSTSYVNTAKATSSNALHQQQKPKVQPNRQSATSANFSPVTSPQITRTSQRSVRSPTTQTTTAFMPQPQIRAPPARVKTFAWFCCCCEHGPQSIILSPCCQECNHTRDPRCQVREVPENSVLKNLSQSPAALFTGVSAMVSARPSSPTCPPPSATTSPRPEPSCNPRPSPYSR